MGSSSKRDIKVVPPPVEPARERRGRFLNGLETFVVVASAGGISAAARALGMAQPSVTQRLQALEETFGTTLLHRTQSGTELTPAGRIVLTYAERLLLIRDEMLAELKGHTDVATGTLRVAASTTPGNYVLPALLRQFHTAYPGIRVVVDVRDSSQSIEAVRDGKAELGLVGLGAFGSDLRYEPLIEDEIVVVGAPNHPLMQRPTLTLEDLRTCRWVIREPGSGTRNAVEALLGKHQDLTAVDVSLEVNSTEAAKLAVRAEMGVAFISRRAVENELQLGLLRAQRIEGHPLSRNFFLVHHRARTLSPPAHALWIQLLRRELVGRNGHPEK